MATAPRGLMKSAAGAARFSVAVRPRRPRAPLRARTAWPEGDAATPEVSPLVLCRAPRVSCLQNPSYRRNQPPPRVRSRRRPPPVAGARDAAETHACRRFRPRAVDSSPLVALAPRRSRARPRTPPAPPSGFGPRGAQSRRFLRREGVKPDAGSRLAEAGADGAGGLQAALRAEPSGLRFPARFCFSRRSRETHAPPTESGHVSGRRCK